MTARLVTACEICGGPLETVLDLGSSPPTCVMAKIGERPPVEHHHPLELRYCDTCAHGQLSVIVDPDVMFPASYPYQSGNSRELHRDFEDLSQRVRWTVGEWSADDLIVDIGANDGTLLSKFPGLRTVGVEPTGQAAKVHGPVYREFFTADLARRIRMEHGPARVVTACNVLAHVEDIHDVLEGVSILLDKHDGVFVVENHDLQSVADGQWDTVYHEHIRFYSPHSFAAALNLHGLSVYGLQSIRTHGGSFRVTARKGRSYGIDPPKPDYDFRRLQADAILTRYTLRDEAYGSSVGIGATARATTVINYCGLDVEDIQYVCEVPGSDKIGHYVPGTRIPIVDEQRLIDEQPERAILFSWHLADIVVPKLRDAGYDGEVLVPLPRPEVVL